MGLDPKPGTEPSDTFNSPVQGAEPDYRIPTSIFVSYTLGSPRGAGSGSRMGSL